MPDVHFLRGLSLYDPWASMIAAGIKPIETREHDKYRCLKGEDIFIHVAKSRFAHGAFTISKEFITPEQKWKMQEYLVNLNREFGKGGFIIAIAHVDDHRLLTAADNKYALIDCGEITRYGLILSNIRQLIKPIAFKGSQGIMKSEEAYYAKVRSAA